MATKLKFTQYSLILILFFSCQILSNISAQDIYTLNLSKDIPGEIQEYYIAKVNLNTCQTSVVSPVIQLEFIPNDIALSPNGNLYGIAARYRSFFDSIAFFQIDTLTGRINNILKEKIKLSSNGVFDSKGIFHGFNSFGSTFQNFDLSIPSITPVRNTPETRNILSQITYYQGYLYGVEDDGDDNGKTYVFEVDPDSTAIKRLFELPKLKASDFGEEYFLTTVVEGCDSNKLYAIVGNTISIVKQSKNDKKGNIYEVDIYNKKLIPVCQNVFDDTQTIRSVTTRTENLGSVNPRFRAITLQGSECTQPKGSVSLRAVGDNPPFSFSFDGGKTYQPQGNIGNLPNGTYNLRIKDANGCPSRDSTVVLRGLDSIKLLPILKATTCGLPNGSLRLDAEAVFNKQNRNFSFQLNNDPFSTKNVFDSLKSGNYRLKVRDNRGCTDSTFITIPKSDSLKIIAIRAIPSTDCANPYGQIIAQASGNGALRFSLNGGVTFQNELNFDKILRGSYKLIVRDTQNCEASKNNIILETNCYIFVPNAFSPNQDGINDELIINADTRIVAQIEEFKIFGRWGNLLFSRQNFRPNEPDFAWDGKVNNTALDNQTCVYFAKIRLKTGEIRLIQGDITLIK